MTFLNKWFAEWIFIAESTLYTFLITKIHYGIHKDESLTVECNELSWNIISLVDRFSMPRVSDIHDLI